MTARNLHVLAPHVAPTWLDLGSGAGFSRARLRNHRQGRAPQKPILSSSKRTGERRRFLREVARGLHLGATVLHRRIEQLSLPPQDVISARALAPLGRLLAYAIPYCHRGTVLLFPKGRQADSELTLARRAWHIRAVRVPSRTEPGATILKLSEVSRRR